MDADLGGGGGGGEEIHLDFGNIFKIINTLLIAFNFM